MGGWRGGGAEVPRIYMRGQSVLGPHTNTQCRGAEKSKG